MTATTTHRRPDTEAHTQPGKTLTPATAGTTGPCATNTTTAESTTRVGDPLREKTDTAWVGRCRSVQSESNLRGESP